MSESLGAFLKRSRDAANLTQEVIAERLGVTPSYISQVETNRKSPSWRLLLAYSRELKTGVVELLRRAGLIAPDTVTLEQEIAALIEEEPAWEPILQAARRLRPEQLPALTGFMRYLLDEGDNGMGNDGRERR